MPLRSLNEEQFEAATAPFGQNLIIASAGTGKTSTIVARIGYLLKKGTNPQDILLLTFTNKAAAEMVERVGRYFDEKIANSIIMAKNPVEDGNSPGSVELIRIYERLMERIEES
jgi:DNA helicase-2/ATP-dependent DNA helicase PcrA